MEWGWTSFGLQIMNPVKPFVTDFVVASPCAFLVVDRMRLPAKNEKEGKGEGADGRTAAG